MKTSAALSHKLLANYFGRQGDAYADARDVARATGDTAVADANDLLAAAAYQQEGYHLNTRQALGGRLGGQQPTAALAAAYAARA